MKQSLKENMVLIVGLGLPILLAIVFLVASKISVMGIEPPKSTVIFVTNMRHNGDSGWDAKVRDGKVYAIYTAREKGWMGTAPVFHQFNPVTKQSREFQPKHKNVEESVEVLVEGFDPVTSTLQASPDGYTLVKTDDRRNPGLVSELFGGNRGLNYVLANGNYKMDVPGTTYYDTVLIGWSNQ